MFSTEKPTVPTARMRDQVDALLRDLRRADFPNVPTANGPDACLRWMKDGWLSRHPDDDGNEVYSLTANALDGLKSVERLTQDRSVSLSSHLIAGLIRHLRDFSASVSPDVGGKRQFPLMNTAVGRGSRSRSAPSAPPMTHHVACVALLVPADG
jgi:hypothetical protein